jgi:hypothetical protein
MVWNGAAPNQNERLSIYIDGVLAGTAPTSPQGDAFNSTRPLRMGKFTAGTATLLLKGALDDVRIYRHALTPSQIGAIRNTPSP